VSDPKFDVTVHVGDLGAYGTSHVMSLVTRALWGAGASEGQILLFCTRVSGLDPKDALLLAARWVHLVP